MSLDADIDRAQQAAAVINNPAFTEAFALVSQAIHEAWESAPIRDTEGQQILKLQLKLLGDVRANLERAIADGKVAAHELDRRRKSNLADFKR
jgi:hypothetical protein